MAATNMWEHACRRQNQSSNRNFRSAKVSFSLRDEDLWEITDFEKLDVIIR